MVDIKKILVPTDFSASSTAAIRFVRTLAPVFRAEVLLAHAVPAPLYPFSVFSAPDLDEQIRASAASRLEAMAEAERAHRIDVRSILREGNPYEELIDIARREAVDLIVMATHGYTGFKPMLLGSTTEKVLRGAPCPVLVVPPAAIHERPEAGD